MSEFTTSDCTQQMYPWTVLVVTCTTSEAALAVKKELILLQRKKVIHEATICLTVEDPDKHIGSGGATLNALLVAVEHISAKRGFNVLNPDILLDSHILIFHNGRPSFFEVCGKGFLTLPTRGYGGLSKTNLERLLTIVGSLARSSSKHGLWVCSTDMLLLTRNALNRPIPSSFPPTDCVLFSALATTQYGTGHGVLKLLSKTDGELTKWDSVADICYCRPIDEVETLLWKDTGKVPLVCGLVYLSSHLSEALLSLHTQTPLNSCTYLGLDSGAEPVQVSLFFDILIAMSENISKEAFLAGDCGKTYGIAHSYIQNERTNHIRELVWTNLRRFKMGAVVLQDLDYLYLSYNSTVSSHMKLLNELKDLNCTHESDSSLPFINSLCDRNVILPSDSSSIIQHCVLKSKNGKTIHVGNNSFLSGVVLDSHSQEVQLEIGDNLALIVFRMPYIPDKNDCEQSIAVLLGTNDELRAPFTSPTSTFCNVDWTTFFERSGIKDSDIWDTLKSEKQKCLFNANLFPVNGRIEDILWFYKNEGCQERGHYLRRWRATSRICLREILELSRPMDEFCHRREVSCAIAIHEIWRALSGDVETSLDPLFRCALVEGWADRLYDVLDNLAMGCDSEHWNPGKAARVLGNVANLLGCLADGEGGLRSGPAANKDWMEAYHIFEKNCPGSIRNGVAALRKARLKWMNIGPHWLIRAARHYEGAAQILIRHAVFTAKNCISIYPGQHLPQMGVWVTCECPARVDLFGGWTDTPPICYELGGSVVNASILVNGKRPIGAKICRCSKPRICLYLDEGVKLTLGHIDDLLDYNQPTSIGALAKACIIWTGIIQLDSNLGFKEQLAEKCEGAGFELYTWSNLPQGSGLGTSSIMAGAIIAVLWTVTGIKYDKGALIHGVLCIEQMLTTGGGWQDQVGGLTGGFVHGHTHPGLPLRVQVEKLNLRQEFVEQLERHLVLIYTGKIRLAKNLLQNVLRNWFARDAAMLNTFQNLGKKALAFTEALKEENLPKIGQLMNEYWHLKKCLAPGAEPAGITVLMEALKPHSYGRLLCGAGGGGFMLVLIKNANDQAAVNDVIRVAEPSGILKYSLAIDTLGISVCIGDERVPVQDIID